MINPFQEVNWRPGLSERRKFALSLMIGFPAIALVFLLIRGLATGNWNPVSSLWIGGVGFAVGAILWLLPFIALPFYVVWYFVSCCIGFVISNVALTVFYYTLVTGIGLMRRVFGNSPVTKGFNKDVASYWKDVEPVTDTKRYYSQF